MSDDDNGQMAFDEGPDHNLPARPYIQDGAPSAGYAEGSDTSREAEPARSADQRHVLLLLSLHRKDGLVGHEANDAIGKPRQTTGQSCLSTLHEAGLVERLAERRDGQQIYVLPMWVMGRETKPRGRHGRKRCPHCGGTL